MGLADGTGGPAFTPHRPEFIEDPLSSYRWLRDEAPVFHVRVGGHLDPVPVRRCRGGGTGLAHVLAAPSRSGTHAVKDARPVLTATDPPQHTELRSHTRRLFTPRAVDGWRVEMEALFDQLLDAAFSAAGPVNFAEDVANPYLSRLVGRLMGIPEADQRVIKEGATATSLVMSGDFSQPAVDQRAAFGAYFDRFVQQRAAGYEATGTCPGPFTERLFQPSPSGRDLTHAERVPYQTLLATGGNETTAQLLSNLTLLLSHQPWILEALHERPELRPSAVEEALRFVSPVTGMFRHTTTPVERHGVTIPDDAKVLLMYGAANHDERHYARPDEFVIDRYPRGFADADHLASATGVHVCLGGHLARALVDVYLEHMAHRVRTVEVTGPVLRSHNALVRVVDELPVRLVPAP